MSNKIKISTYVYEKVPKHDVEVNIPTEPIYYQNHNHKTIVALIPKFADWDDNRVYGLKILSINANFTSFKIINSELDVSPQTISNILATVDHKPKSDKDYLNYEVVDYLIKHYGVDTITEEDFIRRYNTIIECLDHFINLKR